MCVDVLRQYAFADHIHKIKFSGEAKLLEEWEDEESLVKRIHWNDCIVSGFCEDKNFEIIE